MSESKYAEGERVEQWAGGGWYVGTVTGHTRDGLLFVKWDGIDTVQQVPPERVALVGEAGAMSTSDGLGA